MHVGKPYHPFSDHASSIGLFQSLRKLFFAASIKPPFGGRQILAVGVCPRYTDGSPSFWAPSGRHFCPHPSYIFSPPMRNSTTGSAYLFFADPGKPPGAIGHPSSLFRFRYRFRYYPPSIISLFHSLLFFCISHFTFHKLALYITDLFIFTNCF